MKKKIITSSLKMTDFVPAISGLIGKIALVSSFAVMWARELNITTPNFVFENVRIEIILGSIITLIAAIMLKHIAPSGTLAPLVVLIPAMVQFGVHPLVLSILVAIMGIISIKTRLFHKLISLSGYISKTSITLTFGVSGVYLSTKNLISFYGDEYIPFIMVIFILIITYFLLLKWKMSWLVIPAAAVVSILVSISFGFGIDISTTRELPNFSPFYWWNEMWGIGFGFNFVTIIKTLPFAMFVILLWAIDTLSIKAMGDANYQEGEEREEMDLDKSFIITSIRNMVVGTCGGAQTSALWRSYLIPLFMVKRPLKYSSILLGIFGILAGFSATPIKILSFPPLIWSVLLFGIFVPFTIVGIKNTWNMKSLLQKVAILIFTALGVLFNPIFTWIGALVYEKTLMKTTKKS